VSPMVENVRGNKAKREGVRGRATRRALRGVCSASWVEEKILLVSVRAMAMDGGVGGCKIDVGLSTQRVSWFILCGWNGYDVIDNIPHSAGRLPANDGGNNADHLCGL